MSSIEWSDNCLIGIPEIDAEHRELVQSVNVFLDAQDGPAENDGLFHTLSGIFSELESHFLQEEQLMQKYIYDQYDDHKLVHDQLLSMIRETIKALEADQEYDRKGLEEHLVKWFPIHFKTHDARLHRLHDLIKRDQQAGGAFASLFGEDTGEYWGKK